jgi:hypothetical protein
MLTEHALLRGAGYAFINWRSRESNIVDELIPLNPDRVQVEQMPDMSLRYTVTTQAGAQIPVAAEDIFTVRYRSRDGLQPVGVIDSGRDAIGVAYATQEYAGRFYRNDATPGVVLKHPGKLSKEAAERLKDNWNNVYSGVGLAAGTKGDRTRLVIMQGPDPLLGMIGLLEFVAPRMAEPVRRERLGIGDIVFVMQGRDVHGVHVRALERGFRVHAAPHEFSVKGASGQLLQMTSLSLWDPDDYFIEYNQRQEAA